MCGRVPVRGLLTRTLKIMQRNIELQKRYYECGGDNEIIAKALSLRQVTPKPDPHGRPEVSIVFFFASRW